MALTKTTRLNLAKQDLGDLTWHTHLNTGMDDADARFFLEATAPPNGVVTSQYVGQRLWDKTNFGWYTAKTAGVNNAWVADIPPGTIWAYSGNVGAIPDGWYLADGTNGTPNLKGRFIVGYDSADADYDAVGDVGGAKTVALTSAQVPVHDDHAAAQTSVVAGLATVNSGGGANVGSASHVHNTPVLQHTYSADGAAHENRPPFYTLAYIWKR